MTTLRWPAAAATLALLAAASAPVAAQTASEPFSYGPVQPTAAATGDVAAAPYAGMVDTAAETRAANGPARVRGSIEMTAAPSAASGWSSDAHYPGHYAYAGPASAPAARTADAGGSYLPPAIEEPEIDAAGTARSVRVPRDRSTGHFVTNVVMNGVRIPVIIDTGATGTILSPAAAIATGAVRDVTHAQYAAGIGGVTALSVTRVRSFSIGGREIGGFDAMIGREGIPYTLLGQTELRRLGRIVIDNDVLTITPRDDRVVSR